VISYYPQLVHIRFCLNNLSSNKWFDFQNSISKCLHHHTFFSMFFNGIFEAHHARVISCFGPKASLWLTIWSIFPSFQLVSSIFSTTFWIRLGLPHPSIVSIPWCVCAHMPLTLWVSISYIVFMTMNAQEPMIQFVTSLLPFAWDVGFHVEWE